MSCLTVRADTDVVLSLRRKHTLSESQNHLGSKSTVGIVLEGLQVKHAALTALSPFSESDLERYPWLFLEARRSKLAKEVGQTCGVSKTLCSHVCGAAESKVEKSDSVTEIDGKSTTSGNVIQLLRGSDEIGSRVTIQVEKPDKTKSKFTLTRADMRSVEKVPAYSWSRMSHLSPPLPKVKDLYLQLAELQAEARAPRPDKVDSYARAIEVGAACGGRSKLDNASAATSVDRDGLDATGGRLSEGTRRRPRGAGGGDS
eukprot:753283-Hanusia_phi.AAC.2